MKKVIVLGTLDTKGEEFQFVKDILEGNGIGTLVVDTGVKGEPYFKPDIGSKEVALAGGRNLEDLIAADDRGAAMDVMMHGAAAIVADLHQSGAVAGIISLGGSAGTTIGTYAMKVLPIGVPKIMVSTIASGDTRPFVGAKDITMMYSVVDISGINLISLRILSNAAFAMAGMVKGTAPLLKNEKILIGAMMFGVTTPCVTKVREYLEDKGYEVLVFHATGTGGMAMESLIESGYIKGVLDITTTEMCDELAGGIFSAGPHRMESAARGGIPQVVSVGALDMVNFGSYDTVPEKFKSRKLYRHNANITLMRTNADENRELGKIIAGKLNLAQSPTALFLPLGGVSAIDVPGKPFYGPEEDHALFEALRANIQNDLVEMIEMDTDINDEAFALAMAKKLIELIEKS